MRRGARGAVPPFSGRGRVAIRWGASGRTVSWGDAPAPRPTHGRGHGGRGRRGPQNGQPTRARDQYQHGGQTQEQRIQGCHRGDLLAPLVRGMQGHKTETVLVWGSPSVPCAPCGVSRMPPDASRASGL